MLCRTWSLAKAPIRALMYLRDRTSVVCSVSEEREMRLHSTNSESSWSVPLGGIGYCVSANMGSNTGLFAVGMSGGAVAIYDCRRLSLPLHLMDIVDPTGKRHGVSSVYYKDNLLVTNSMDSTVRIWDIKDTVKHVQTLQGGHINQRFYIQMDVCNPLVAVGCEMNHVVVYRMGLHQPLAKLQLPSVAAFERQEAVVVGVDHYVASARPSVLSWFNDSEVVVSDVSGRVHIINKT